MQRKILAIDEERCDGCGLCASACAEGAIQIIDGKARLVKDDYCDGLGACIGECPRSALTIIERDAPAFDEAAVARQLAARQAPAPHAGCPGAAMRQLAPRTATACIDSPSALRQWPVQLHLVSPTAPYFRDADLLLAADCCAFACGDFHARFLADHAVAIACPKLDDSSGYVEKLAMMITDGGIRSITMLMMQVPCCRGLERMAMMARDIAGVDIPVRRVIVGIEGGILTDEMLP